MSSRSSRGPSWTLTLKKKEESFFFGFFCFLFEHEREVILFLIVSSFSLYMCNQNNSNLH